jgi:uncharacterized repeat protein (TIGR02543 family)
MFSYLKKLSFWLFASIALWWSFTFAIGTWPIVFHHIYGGGGNSWAPYESDFVVLYNNSASDVNLTWWELQNWAATSTLPLIGRNISLSWTIPAWWYYLIEITTNTTAWIPLSDHIIPNITAAYASSAWWMGNNNNKLRLIDNTLTVVDFVGFWSTTNEALVWGIVTALWTTAPNISNTTSIIRVYTSGSNSTDFIIQNNDCGLHSSAVCLLYMTQNIVTFQDYDFSFISSWLVYYGSWATAPSNPSRTGYTFSGWNNDFSNVTWDLTVTAEYIINAYTVTFEDRDNNFISSWFVTYGSWATAPSNPSRTGYTFSGWNNDFSNVTWDLTVTAEYIINAYTVTFEDRDNNFISSWFVTYGSWATAPSNPSRTGYTFSGWNNDFSNVTWHLTVTAEYIINAYTVTFEDRDNNFISSWFVTYGSWATAPSNPSRTGYTFSGWNNDFSNVTWHLTVTAEYIINAYTVTFEDRDNNFISSWFVTYGSWATAPSNPSRTGYTFSGWNNDFSNVTWDLTVTAEYIINAYTVTFEDRDNNFISSWFVTYGSWATAPSNPSRTGYTFSGWNNDFSNVTWHLTVTAEYIINAYTVTFDTDWGIGVALITWDYNSLLPTPANPTKTGYVFSGWMPILPSTMPAANIIVVAQWILIPVVTETGWFAGGWWWSLPIDYCPNGDYTESYYDSQCGNTAYIEADTGLDIRDTVVSSSICTQPDYKIASFQWLKKVVDKRQFVVCWLHNNKQTIFDNVSEFDYDRVVTREEASRMITRFVKEILKKDKVRNNNDPLCQFTDLKLANLWLRSILLILVNMVFLMVLMIINFYLNNNLIRRML